MSNFFKKIEAIASSGKQFTENRGYTARPIHPIQGTLIPPGETVIDVDVQLNSPLAARSTQTDGD